MKNHVNDIILAALNESVIDGENSFQKAISEKLVTRLGQISEHIGGSLFESVKVAKKENVTESYFLQNPQLQKAIDYVVSGVIKEGVNSFEKYINLAENRFGVYDNSLKNYFIEAVDNVSETAPKKVAKVGYKGPIKKIPTSEETQPGSHISAIKNFIANKPVKPNVKADDVFGPRRTKRKSTSGIGKAKRRR